MAWFFLASIGFTLFAFWRLYGESHSISDYRVAPVAFSHVVAEYLVAALLLVLTASSRLALQIAGALAASAILFLQCLQVIALYYSGDGITSDVLAHAGLVGLMINTFTIPFALVSVVGVMGVHYALARRSGILILNARQRLTGAMAIGSAIAVLLVLNNNLDRVKYVKFSFQAGKVSALGAFYSALSQGPASTGSAQPLTLTASDLEVARQFGIEVNPESPFPFARKDIYDAPLPFPAVGGSGRPNVIVLFVESLSQRFIETGQEGVPGLTPNILDFSSRSLVVSGYYNHVFPTIVGVRGQLCSAFPLLLHTDWSDAKFKLKAGQGHCMPKMLEEDGYEAVYLGYSHPSETFFDDQMAEIGFSQRHFFSELLQHFGIPGEPARQRHGNGDRQMMQALSRFLETRQQDRPFFLALSTVETHPGLDVLDEAMRFGDGTSEVLNGIHAFDAAFGEFWEYFKRSRWSRNTVVVLTADHAHAAGVEFAKLIRDPGYANMAFDRIPLVIHDPFHELPRQLETRATSVDFAPTIMQLAGAPNRPNAFFGRSLFTGRSTTSGGVGLLKSNSLCLIDASGARVKDLSMEECAKADAQQPTCSLYKIVSFFREMDGQDRIWGPGAAIPAIP